jgi:hypothetical protein
VRESQARQYILVILTVQEVAVGGWQFEVSLDKLGGPHLKSKIKKKTQNITN